MRSRYPKFLITLFIAALSLAQAATLVFYPLESNDPVLGVAVAERLSEAFSSSFEVYGPAEAPALVPPFVVQGGFFNPTAFVQGLADSTGAELVRSALGASAAVTGSVDNVDGQLQLQLFLATTQQASSVAVSAPAADPGLLAQKAADVLAGRLGLSRAPRTEDIDLSGPFGITSQAITLLGAGFLNDTAELLDSVPADQLQPRALELRTAIDSVQQGSFTGDPALLATLSVNRDNLDEQLSLEYFTRFAQERELPAAQLWRAVLLASVDDSAAAAAFEGAAVYPYGSAAQAAFTDQAAPQTADIAALLVNAVAAQGNADLPAEKLAWLQLTRSAPWFTYPFERLSFIAFDEDEPLTAAQMLAVAVELEPGNDLYWTNLGWATYLLGLFSQSEDASINATLLAPDQYVAHYNLGLVRAVTGRLQAALAAYDEALYYSAGVDPAALDDLEAASRALPRQATVNYALAYLYEAAGRRADAAMQYERYVQRTDQGPYLAAAQERMTVLRGPAPELQLPGPLRVFLGTIDVTGQTLHPGDPLTPDFEVYTPGEVLPAMITVSISLHDGAAEEVLAVTREVAVPADAIGFVVNRLPLPLPDSLPAGSYELQVQITATEDREAVATAAIQVAGSVVPLRQLLGYNIIMQDLQGLPLYGRSDLAHPEGLTGTLLLQLQQSASAADDALPPVTQGRFSGQTGGQVFRNSTAADVQDFIAFMISPELRDATFAFVEAYAQWALDGAPQAEDLR